MYVCYLIIYLGNKLPKFYIGSTSLLKIKKGYKGSINSKRWKDVYKKEVKNNINLFKIKILSKHKNRIEALEQELLFQKHFDVVKNSNFINEAFASVNGMFGRNVKGELNPNYGKIVSIETRRKIGEGNSKALKGNEKSEEHKKALSKHGINKVPVKDKDGKQFLVFRDDERYLLGELVSVTKGKVNVKDKNGNGFCVYKDDPRYLSGELISTNVGRIVSEETKEKLREKIKCPYCEIERTKSSAKRYHFDNCKLK